MNIKKVCDSIELEIKKIEAERESFRNSLKTFCDEIEQSRQKSQSQHAVFMAECDKQLANIQIYLNQIPTNINYVKKIGREMPLNEGTLTQMALLADRSGRISDYEKLYETAMGMFQYVKKHKSVSQAPAGEIQMKEREYDRNKKQYQDRIDQAYRRLFQSENYLAAVKYIADSRQNLRNMMGAWDLLIGRRYTDFHFPKECHSRIRADFGNFFDAANGRLLIPFYKNISQGFKILIKSDGDLGKQDEMVESILYSLLCTDALENYRIQYIDCVRLTGAGTGKFQSILNKKNRLFMDIPSQENEVGACLDVVFGLCRIAEEELQKSGAGNLYEWNAAHPKEKQRKRLLIILEGFPIHFQKRELDRIRQLLVNSDRWGISFIISVDNRKLELEQAHTDMKGLVTAYGLDGFMKMNCPSANIQIAGCGNISAEMAAKFLVKGNESIEKTKYTDWFDLHKKPDYQNSFDISAAKKRMPVRVPLGVDQQGRLQEIEFGGMTFAGYLMGTSGSGKSTLIHTMIASILYRYHPDDVELWLVDFKMMEFSRYIEKMPPHVKYIVLDYSPKVVYDLLDRATAELARRTDIFAKHPEWKGNIDNVPVSAGLPRIFLIIDEFEKMAKILAGDHSGVDKTIYKNKIASLLQEGRSAGFRILFSSQNYKAGVNILEDNARNNIGIRIAMKNKEPKEMKAVLNIQGDEYDDKLNYLPPHELLIVEKDLAAAKTTLHQMKTLWFPDEQEIQNLQANLKRYFVPVPVRQSGNIREYLDKNPSVISGKRLNSFEELQAQLIQRAGQSRQDGYFDEDVPVFFGNLQAMDSRKPVWLTAEKNQNICLVAPQIYAPYAASIVLSTIKCFQNAGVPVMIIGYRRSPVYSRYQKCWEAYPHTDEPMEADRWLDGVVSSILDKSCKPMLIVLCGLSELAEEVIAEKEEQELQKAAFEKKREEQEKEQERKDQERKDQERKERNKSNEKKDSGEVSMAEMMEELKRQAAKETKENIKKRQGILSPILKTNSMPQTISRTVSSSRSIWDNIKYIQQYGSRKGIHLLTVAGVLKDLEEKPGINVDFYDHLLSFKIPSHGMITRLKDAKEIGEGDDFADDSICMYSGREIFTFRPFLHKEVTWGGWQVNDNGKAWKP